MGCVPSLSSLFFSCFLFKKRTKMTIKNFKLIFNIARSVSTKPSTNADIQAYITNRNPRNLERLRLDRKPCGYYLDDVNIEYWHKLEVKRIGKYVVAQIVHNNTNVVVQASTNEWAICKHLFSKSDKAAYLLLAKVFAERCLETGIYSFFCDIVPHDKESKSHLFLTTLEEEGLTLSEPSQFNIEKMWHVKREKRPWTVLED